MFSVWIGGCRAPLGLKTMVAGVPPAHWAGPRNGRAVGARPTLFAVAGRMVLREFLPWSTRGVSIGLLVLAVPIPRNRRGCCDVTQTTRTHSHIGDPCACLPTAVQREASWRRDIQHCRR